MPQLIGIYIWTAAVLSRTMPKPKGLYILYCTLLLLNISCLTRQNMEPQNSDVDVVLTIFRGSRTSPDRVNICPTKPGIELDSRHITGNKTMSCSGEKDGICGQNGEFSGYTCTCKKSSPVYVVSKRHCVNNVWLRQGCGFRFGSWRSSTGWTWNMLDDPPLSLYVDDGYGITGGFNASSWQFERCSLSNVTALTKTGVWGKVAFDLRAITFFVLRGYFHITWNTENLDSESRQTIRGRLLRFTIKCQPPEPKLHNDISRDPTESCLIFKATGNYTVSSDEEKKDESKEDNTKTVAIALGVTFSILLLAGIVIGVACYRRRRSGTNITPRFLSDFIARIT